MAGDDDRMSLYEIVKARRMGRSPRLRGVLAPLEDNGSSLAPGDLRLSPTPPLASPNNDPARFRRDALNAPDAVKQQAEAFASRRMDLLEKDRPGYKGANLNEPETMATYANARNNLRDLYMLGALHPRQQITGPDGIPVTASEMLRQLQNVQVHVGQSRALRAPDEELRKRGYNLRPEELNDPNGRAYLAAATLPPGRTPGSSEVRKTTDTYINPWHQHTVNSLDQFADPETARNWFFFHEVGGHGMLGGSIAGHLDRPNREAYANAFGGPLAKAINGAYPSDEELQAFGGVLNVSPFARR
jgi:hypothetical protein